MPVSAMVNISRFRENSFGRLLWGPGPLSAALASLHIKIQRINTHDKERISIILKFRISGPGYVLKRLDSSQINCKSACAETSC